MSFPAGSDSDPELTAADSGDRETLRPVPGQARRANTRDTLKWEGSPLTDDGDSESSHVIAGRYRIVEALGYGGMGRIFRVVHRRLTKDFALKIIHPRMADDSTVVGFFHREARALSQLNHPNIVQVTDFGHDQRFGAYLVMEYLAGETLHDYLERVPIPKTKFSLGVILQVAQALYYMHRHDLIHCDIKPENVFLCPRTRPQGPLIKLIDFGFSRAAVADAELASDEVAATPAYAAPEQLEGWAPQPSMDIYALGSLLFELITGELPFVGSPSAIISRKLDHPAPDPESVAGKKLDPTLVDLVRTALRRDPQERQADMGTFVHQLRRVWEHTTSPGKLRRVDRISSGKRQVVGTPGAPGVPTFTVGRDGCVTSASPSFVELVAWGAEDIAGQQLGHTRLGHVHAAIDQDVRKVLKTGKPLQRKLEVLTASGKPASLLLWLTTPDPDGGPPESVSGVLVPLMDE